jgi:hypothetical protein
MSYRFSVVTTFNASGYQKYGQRMIQTFLKNWPTTVELIVYAEDCDVTETAPNLSIRNLTQASPELVAFKTRWKDIPKANGDVSNDPVRSTRKDAGKGFKWDAVRFSHKVYSIFHCAKNAQTEWLIWMDADMVCHSTMSVDFLNSMCNSNYDICFLGRNNKYTECGLYAINLKTSLGQLFLTRFQEFYDQDTIFKFPEWHDSYVFDEVRNSIQCRELDWSQGIIKGEGHPLINSKWGAFLDHLKGSRKLQGHSNIKDLKIVRSESYWSSLNPS